MSMTVFGDSLSDTGNVFVATGGTVPTTPYSAGRFSDGPVWIDHLATGLGLPSGAVAFLLGGNNYAFGGARTGAGTSPVPGLLAQIGGVWAPTHPTADANGLYVVVGGVNDIRDARSAFPTNSAGDQAGRQAAAEATANNLRTGLGLLAGAGARHVLIATLPDLGNTPEASALGLVAASSDASARFNALIPVLEAFAELNFGLDVDVLDMAGIDAAIQNDPAAFGISNADFPCAPFPGNAGALCSESAFSDALHPSARVHAIYGEVALTAVTAVPEPSSLALIAGAMVIAGGLRRRVVARG
jgi:phospholipase/lecithinase/hemolysin